MMFTRDSPAESIVELTEWFGTHHDPKYLYRGQRKEYKTLIPSSFRKLDIGEFDSFRIISEDGYFSGSEAESFQHVLMNDLIAQFGADMGSYIAQQYFCFSQSLDFSSSYGIAAFFATYSGPDFNRPIQDSQELGIIYRLDKTQFKTPPPDSKRRIGQILDDPEQRELDLFVLREHPAAQIDGWKPKQYWFSPNWLKKHTPTIVDRRFALTSRIYTVEDFVEKAPFFFKSADAQEVSEFRSFFSEGAHPPIRYLRPLVQRGAVVTPRMLWKCQIPFDMQDENGMPIRSAWGDCCIGVEDIAYHSSIDRYYFRHQGIPITIPTRESLWPKECEDASLAPTRNWVLMNSHRYPGVKLNEVIDFGFASM